MSEEVFGLNVTMPRLQFVPAKRVAKAEEGRGPDGVLRKFWMNNNGDAVK